MKANKRDILLGAMGFKKALDCFKYDKDLAERIKERKQKINYWKLYGSVPCEKAIEICVATKDCKGRVTLVELCPHLKKAIEEYNNMIIEDFKKSIGLI